jgi:hypothetical protein
MGVLAVDIANRPTAHRLTGIFLIRLLEARSKVSKSDIRLIGAVLGP